MPIAAGTRLGSYEIGAPLGRGGMGVVYRARDTKLGRHVAIKVLPDELAVDEERVARFEREAKLLASLNHPNIAHVYGFESADLEDGRAAHFLAMELVEGEDLSERLKRGPVPVDEALGVAKQIAEALEEAHEKGIVHRDLKPANVELTPDGRVKVLDFGLAKALIAETADSASNDLSQSPTLAQTGTMAGVILGTASYMSPEQARGKPVDKRADIWAFGVVLYEMLTGGRLFDGETTSDVLAAVLRQEIPWKALPAATPQAVQRLLVRCLERDPRVRLRDAGEARIALGLVEEAWRGGPTAPVSGVEAPPRWPRLVVLAGVLLVGLAVGSLLPWGRASRPAPSRPGRTLIVPAAGRTLDDSQAISPDGRWIAYTAGGALWIRNLGELDPREVPESRGAEMPFWSPRSDAVAFAARGTLFKITLEGGKPVELCRIPQAVFTGGSWSASRGIVFTASAANWNGDVLRVSEEGGAPEPFSQPDASKGELRLFAPHFLPNGRDLLFTAITETTASRDLGELVVERDGAHVSLGVDDAKGAAAWSPSGHVLFSRGPGMDRSLWALPFSLEAGAPTGDPFRIAVSGTDPSASKDGALLYARPHPDPQQLVWVDRSGRRLEAIGEPVTSLIEVPVISPDGRRVTASVGSEMVVWDMERGVVTRASSNDPNDVGGSGNDWSPDGEEILYSSPDGLKLRRADGTGEPKMLNPRPLVASPSFSRDGKYVVFYVVEKETSRDLWALAVSKPDEPFPLVQTPANENLGRISPDGRFLAYQSDASGRWEVVVQPFPRGEGRWQVSVSGGQQPMWSPRGDEIFFVNGNDLMVADVTSQPAFRVGTPRRLFGGEDVETNLAPPGIMERHYDVAADGRRFVVVQGYGTGTSDIVLDDATLARTAASGGGKR